MDRPCPPCRETVASGGEDPTAGAGEDGRRHRKGPFFSRFGERMYSPSQFGVGLSGDWMFGCLDTWMPEFKTVGPELGPWLLVVAAWEVCVVCNFSSHP